MYKYGTFKIYTFLKCKKENKIITQTWLNIIRKCNNNKLINNKNNNLAVNYIDLGAEIELVKVSRK